MADTFLLEVATPERLFVREQVTEAQIPAANGYVGILPGHAALLSELGSGELSKKFVVKANAFSASAKDKIEKKGGRAEVVQG